MAATAPLEITELARSSAAVSERALAALPPPKATQELLNNFADQILDVRADTLAFYKIAPRRFNSSILCMTSMPRRKSLPLTEFCKPL
jgi:hypothetical protein